jgi:Tfp pilus assembly protein PilE
VGKLQNNQKGFTAVEGLLIVLILVVIGAVGYMVYHNNHKTTNTNNTASKTSSSSSNTTKTASTPNPYAGWKTDTTSLSGLSFQYPSTWTVNPNLVGSATCTGAVLVGVIPPSSELSQAMTAASYYLEIDKYGTQSSNCAPDGTDFSTVKASSITSTEQIKNGVFSNDWLTFFSGAQTEFFPTQPDTAILTSGSYSGAQTSFTDAGTVQSGGATYQVGLITTTSKEQYEPPVSVNVSSFKTTQLYQDTLNVLNSFKTN